MSERGVFAVDRGVWDHPAFAPEPFSEREAWLWLVSEAAYKAHARRADGKIIEIQRGQLCHAVRFLASAWQWSKSRVDRYLDRLEKHEMLSRERGTRTPVITLSNYDDYQRVALPERDKAGTTARRDRDKLERKKNKEISSETTSLRRARSAPKAISDRDRVLEAFQGVLAPEIAAAVFDHRVKLRKPMTPHAAELLACKFAAAPDPNAAAEVMIANGWRGFEPEWINRRITNADLVHQFATQLSRERMYSDIVDEGTAEIAEPAKGHRVGTRFGGPMLDLRPTDVRTVEGRLL